MKWLAVLVLLAACDAGLAGTYVIEECPSGSFTFEIHSDNTITTKTEPVVFSFVGEPKHDRTGDPNVVFRTERMLYGEGGWVRYAFSLWMDADGGTGTGGGYCDATVHPE